LYFCVWKCHCFSIISRFSWYLKFFIQLSEFFKRSMLSKSKLTNRQRICNSVHFYRSPWSIKSTMGCYPRRKHLHCLCPHFVRVVHGHFLWTCYREAETFSNFSRNHGPWYHRTDCFQEMGIYKEDINCSVLIFPKVHGLSISSLHTFPDWQRSWSTPCRARYRLDSLQTYAWCPQ
jgi:hypothetical protein